MLYIYIYICICIYKYIHIYIYVSTATKNTVTNTAYTMLSHIRKEITCKLNKLIELLLTSYKHTFLQRYPLPRY
jgi:hypothetical protein